MRKPFKNSNAVSPCNPINRSTNKVVLRIRCGAGAALSQRSITLIQESERAAHSGIRKGCSVNLAVSDDTFTAQLHMVILLCFHLLYAQMVGK